METVEVVVRIPKDVYEKIQQIDRIIVGRRNGKTIEFALWNGVKNGTVLPKGHGRLGDLDRLIRAEIQHLLYHLPNGDIAVPQQDIKNAPTIIEADKGGDDNG